MQRIPLTEAPSPLLGQECWRKRSDCAEQQVMVPLRELLTERFLARCSRFSNLESFLAAGGIQQADLLELDSNTARRWDLFVRGSSGYPDWSTMLKEAGSEWVIGRLGVIIDA
ncbi:hypothetical protein [Roseateles sp.]|uniref:hypothetical protein n=1 Tax=Roseateles sp. TaxID=1971397 RepID=UPI0037CC2A62